MPVRNKTYRALQELAAPLLAAQAEAGRELTADEAARVIAGLTAKTREAMALMTFQMLPAQEQLRLLSSNFPEDEALHRALLVAREREQRIESRQRDLRHLSAQAQ